MISHTETKIDETVRRLTCENCGKGFWALPYLDRLLRFAPPAGITWCQPCRIDAAKLQDAIGGDLE
jgi:hypothetical protein